MKTNAYRTKRKIRNEANKKDADKVIDDFLYESGNSNQKTRKILEEYVDSKDKTSGAESSVGQREEDIH